jgi:hypothetical protein
MYELNSKVNYKTIYLDSSNCVINTERNTLTFNNLPVIKVEGDVNFIRLDSITMTSATASNYTGHIWTIKLGNIKYNNKFYYNSDRNAIPTIGNIMIDSTAMINNGLNNLVIDNQNINQIILYVNSSDGHGLIKNSQEIKMCISLIIEEHYV